MSMYTTSKLTNQETAILVEQFLKANVVTKAKPAKAKGIKYFVMAKGSKHIGKTNFHGGRY